jgi:hypothetical protein
VLDATQAKQGQLATVHTNFLHLEIQPQEMDAIPPKQGQVVANNI